MSTTAERRGPTSCGGQLAGAAGLFGVALASIDGCVAILAGKVPGNNETAWFLIHGVAVLCLVSAAAFFAASLALRAVARLRDRDVLPMTAGWASGVILLDVFLVVAVLSRPASWSTSDLVLGAVLALLAGFAGLLTYGAAKHASPQLLGTYAVTFTAYSLIAFAFAWIQLFWIVGPFSAVSMAFTAVCGIIALTVPFLAVRAATGMLYFFTLAPLALAAVAVGTLLLPEQNGPERVIGGEKTISKIVLLSIDTLRSDHVSAYNPTARQTPHLDRLASEGVLFRNSYSLSSWTLPGVASVMTGLPPRYHGANRETLLLDDSMVTLAEHLQAAGYRTAAIGLNPHIAFTNFAQGFDRFQFYPLLTPAPKGTAMLLVAAMFPMRYKSEPSSTELTDLAIDWLRENHSRSFFLWLHYLDPHVPYDLPAGRRPDDPPAQRIIEESREIASAVRAGRVLTAIERAIVKDLYAREVQYVDDEVGRLTAVMEELGIYEESLIAVTSDHGEELWEHGAYEHGHALHEELLRVPLLLRGPGLGPEIREERVGNYQLLSTILGLAGIKNPDPWQSLTPSLFAAAGEGDQTLFAGSNLYYADQNAVLWDRLKCIETIDSGRRDLYDLADAPITDQQQMEACAHLLGNYVTQADKAIAHYGLRHDATQELDEAAKSKLRSLGYIH